MALSVDAFAEASRPKRALCTVAKVLADLSKADAAVLVEVLADDSVTHSAIEKVLSGEGVKLPQNTIARHRRKECACAER